MPRYKLPLRCGVVLISTDGAILIDGQNIVRVGNAHSMHDLETLSRSERFSEAGFARVSTAYIEITQARDLGESEHPEPNLSLCRAVLSWPKTAPRDLAILSRYLPDAIALLANESVQEVWLAENPARQWSIGNHDVPLMDVPESVQQFISPAGPITAIEDLQPQVESSYPLCAAIAHYRIPSAVDAYLGNRYFGSGYGVTPEIARFKAAMEALERFISGLIDEHRIVPVPTPTLLDDQQLFQFLGIDRAAYLRGDFLCKPPSTRTWPTIAAELYSKGHSPKAWLLPYDVVYYPVRPHERQRFAIANSSGVAIHNSWQQAVEHALAEYAERHYLMRSWCAARGFDQCRIDTLPLSIQAKIEHLRAVCPDAEIKVLVHSGKTFFAAYVCFIRHDWPAFHLGSAAHRSPLAAVEKSLDELANAMLYCEMFWPQVDVSEVYDAVDHYCYYHSPIRGKLAHDWASSGQSVNWNEVAIEPTADFARLFATALTEFGEIAIADLTVPPLKAAGLTAVRVLTEKGLPAWFGNCGVPTAKAVWQAEHLDANRWIHPLG